MPGRRQVPKGARTRGRQAKGTHVGTPDPLEHMQAQSIARRYARCDRQHRPLHCHTQQKLMYDTKEIAKSTGEALQRLRKVPYFVYECPHSRHWHLTTHGHGEAVA